LETVSSKGGGGFHGPRSRYPGALLSRLPAGLLLVVLFHPMRAAVLAMAAAAMAAMLPSCGGPRSPSEPAGDLGRRAPGFTLPSASGGRVALSDFTGKPVLLYFSMGPG
jgi:cytochrome oxidase Cu insertion factor (SCO1/SenC/PrrC family)